VGHIIDLPRVERLAESNLVEVGIVRWDRYILDLRCHDRIDEPRGDAAHVEQ
jgi:hypothetical protein